MEASAVNFAAGFFGIPMYQTEYHQLIVIESPGFNNTGAPYDTCINSNLAVGTLHYVFLRPTVEAKASSGNFGVNQAQVWVQKYLRNAVNRLQPQIRGINLTVSDVFAMQEICAYEVQL